MNRKKNILVVSPHADDEVLGAGGYIRKQVKKGNKVDLVLCGVGGIKHAHLEIAAQIHERIEEAKESSGILGIHSIKILFEGMDMKLDTIPMMEIVTELDRVLEKVKYDVVLIPYPSHNHDHEVMFKACWAALRQKSDSHTVPLVASYEYGYSHWTYEPVFGGKMYVDITKYLNKKIEAFQQYKSQIREYPSPVSPKGITDLAEKRGFECGCKYAELFYLHRLVE